jgi:queuine tRNA-ribosyltransferase
MTWQLAAADGPARAGQLSARDGSWLPTPLFQPVATAGSLKTLDWQDLSALGYRHVLMNTYHLVVRPGLGLLERAGGVKPFTGWPGSVLTDSGGYQAFSLARRRKLRPDGITFQDHIAGDMHDFTPESVLRAQLSFGVDFAMCLDVCTGQVPPGTGGAPPATELAAEAGAGGGVPPWEGGASRSRTATDMQLTHAWARQQAVLWPELAGAHGRAPGRATGPAAEAGNTAGGRRPALLGIVQGGLFEDLRAESIALTAALPFDGIAVGGLAVGEPRAEFQRLASFCGPRLPQDRVRYLMGLGEPADLLFAIAHGYDMFDCVQPTRMARHGVAYTWQGKLALRQERFKDDLRPLDPGLAGAHGAAPASLKGEMPRAQLRAPLQEYSRAYLRHLFTLKEHSYARLLTLHNLAFYAELMAEARRRIVEGSYMQWWPAAFEQVDRMLPDGL